MTGNLRCWSFNSVAEEIAEFVVQFLVAHDDEVDESASLVAEGVRERLRCVGRVHTSILYAHTVALLVFSKRFSLALPNHKMLQENVLEAVVRLLCAQIVLPDEDELPFLEPVLRVIVPEHDDLFVSLLEKTRRMFESESDIVELQHLLRRLRLLTHRKATMAASPWAVSALQRQMSQWVENARSLSACVAKTKDIESLLSGLLSDIMNCF